MRRYWPHPERHLAQRIRGSLTEIGLVENVTFPPVTAKVLSVVDWRLRDAAIGVDFLGYPATNGVWPVVITEELRQKLRARIHQAKYNSTGGNLRNTFGGRLMVGVLALAFVAPPLYWAWRRRQIQHSSP
jgi:hypothetical protein